jgi:methyl-accepting chemotaxis protein
MRANYDRFVSEIQARATDPVLYRAVFDLERGFEELKAQGDPVEMLRKAYITDNPYPAGERYKFLTDANFWGYNVAHKNIHASLSPLVIQGAFYDVFLIAPDGDVVYTVAKERDFASNVLTGEWKGTALARVAQQALETGDSGAVFFSDFEHYAPSDNAPAAFAATPIYNAQHTKVGALAFQISSAPADAIMQRRAGLGERGTSFLMGEDQILRSNSSPDATDLLERKVELRVMSEITDGEAQAHVTPGLDGRPAIVAVSPLQAKGLSYYVVAQEPLDDILVPVRNLKLTMARDAGIVLLVVGAIGVMIARSIIRPLRAAVGTVAEIGRKNYSIDITGQTRGDELGDMSRSLAAVRDTLAAGVAAERDSAFKSAAIEAASSVVIIADRDYRILSINPAARRFLDLFEPEIRKLNPDFHPDRVIGTSIDLFHKNPERIRRMLAEPGRMPMRTEVKLGDSIIALDLGEVVLPGEGVIGIVTEWKDVTAERQNRSVLDAIDRSQVTALFEPGGRVVSANANFRSASGTSESSVATAGDLFGLPADGPGIPQVWERLRAGEAVTGRTSLTTPDGRKTILDGGFTPIRDRDGKLTRVLFLANDVTAAEETLSRAEATRVEIEAAQRKVVEELQSALRGLSEGDLTVRITTQFSPQYEELRADFNLSVDRLSEAMTAVVENAHSIHGEVKEISNAADDLSRRTEKQAATLEQTAAALDQLTSSVQSAADGAAEANRVVEDARKSAETSGTVVQETVSAMAEISSSSDKISKIIGVIDDIAFQTNLLALNAGVEAARAGEAGRGFAVVASEVRALAQRSSDAAREINDLISASSTQVRRGVGLVGQAGDALKGIVESVKNIANRVSGIAASAREQSVGLAEINTAVNQLDQVTQQNVAMFEETSAASHALAREADALTATTARFQVPTSSTPIAPASRTPVPAQRPVPSRPAIAATKARTNGALAEANPHEDWHEF